VSSLRSHPKSSVKDRHHQGFLTLLPRIELHGRVFFRFLPSEEAREEAIAEMVALAWKWYLRLIELRKDPQLFPSAIATYAARSVWSGRRLCGQEKSKDVLSSTAQKRHAFKVSSLPAISTLSGNVLSEALRDNTRTPVPDQVSFRLDFPAWLATRTERDRRVILDLMHGERPLDVANKYGLSPGRVSQLRQEFCSDWQRFTEPGPGVA
jgi:hypothetical protein